MKTIQTKLLLIFSILLVLGIAGAVLTRIFISKQKGDAVVINLAGKQRMLTQKMSKEAFSLNRGSGRKEDLQKTINLFDKTLKGLISGDEDLKLNAAYGNKIPGQLAHVSKLWNSFNKNLNVVISNSEEISAAYTYINDT